MRIIFMGTPLFAAASLKKLTEQKHEICAVFTQPDKPKGRGYKLTPSPVKIEAQASGIDLYQPVTLKDEETVNIIKNLSPDVIIVVAYGKILPASVLEIPRLGCINVHASLLPKYRGAAPINRCIIDGERETGITTMFMAPGIDTGDMILKSGLSIGENETYGELHDRLMILGADLLIDTLKLLNGDIPREKQDDALASYAPMIDKSTALINWSKSAAQIHNLIRGLSPSPKAFTTLNNKTIKIIKSQIGEEKCNAKPGEIVKIENDANNAGIYVCCGDNCSIILTEVQEEGKKQMSASEYICGHRSLIGSVMGI